jgi:hypothetical protein
VIQSETKSSEKAAAWWPMKAFSKNRVRPLSVRPLTVRLIALVCVSILVRIGLAQIIPLDGDEAYYLTWAKDLAWGYYDHPPMIAFLIWAMKQVSGQLFVLRFSAVALFPLLAGLSAYWVLRTVSVSKGRRLFWVLALWPVGFVPFLGPMSR